MGPFRVLIKRVREVGKAKETSRAAPIVVERLFIAAESGPSPGAVVPANSGVIRPGMGERLCGT